MADNQDYPTFNDGRRAPKTIILKCWNLLSGGLPTVFDWLEDDIKVAGYSVDHMVDATGEKLGGFSGASVRAGTIKTQLDDAASQLPLPAHIFSLQKGAELAWYVINEVGAPFKGKEVVRCDFGVSRIINPFYSGLLSADEGDTYRKTYSIAAMAATETIAAAPVNVRTGGTLACSLDPLSPAGAPVLPAGVAINATTGVITLTKASVVAGVYEIDVIATDTLANKRTRKGGNKLVLTITA